ncbi:MAG: DUF4416 family protein [bacterium]
MSTIKPHAPVALFVAALYSPVFSDARAAELIYEDFGKPLLPGLFFDFTFSSYYEEEMGRNLRKAFFLLDLLIDPSQLPAWKLRAMELEKQRAAAGKRTINLDPGYLDAPKLVLATAKNFAHRIYLGLGVYADVQLYVKNGLFQTNPWTYPDYQLPAHLHFFAQGRKLYMEKIKSPEPFTQP